MTPSDLVPVLPSLAGVASPVCITGMMTRGGVPAPLMAGHPVSERALAARGSMSNVISTDGGAGNIAHQAFNLGKLSAQFGVSEHGQLIVYLCE